MKRSNTHVWTGLAFVLAAMAVAGGIYGSLRWSSAQQAAPNGASTSIPQVGTGGSASQPVSTASGRVDNTAAVTPSLTREWLSGNWVLTPKGGDDGQTKCSDYANAALTALNKGTTKILTFRSNGQFRSMFNYTTPSGDQHYQPVKARWELSNGKVVLSGIVTEDPFGGNVDGPETVEITPVSDNVLVSSDDGRLVRCVGSTDNFYNDE